MQVAALPNARTIRPANGDTTRNGTFSGIHESPVSSAVHPRTFWM